MLGRKSRNSQKVIKSKVKLNMSGLASTIGKNRMIRSQYYKKTTTGLLNAPAIIQRIQNNKKIAEKREIIKNIKEEVVYRKLKTHFHNMKNSGLVEEYVYKNNTPYSTITLNNSHFEKGTVRITIPGRYVLDESIIFNPNPDNDFKPTKQQTLSGKYPTRREGAYHLGFFAAITVETDNVIIDLNGHSIHQSKMHNLQQRFYANIELANAPFIPKQGPAPFSNDNNYRNCNYCCIQNGVLGLSSHHGIHGNGGTRVLLSNLDILDFEVAAIALNGFKDSSLVNINVKGASQEIPVLSTYSQARFIRPFLDIVKMEYPNALLNIHSGHKTIDNIISDIDASLKTVEDDIKNNKPVRHKLYKNETGLYDGNIYGIVLNANGVVINDFITERSEKTIGNENIYLENIEINNIISEPMEIIGLNPKPLEDKELERLRIIKALEQSPYGGKTQVGPVGDVFQIENNMENGIYKPNVLANAQLIIGKYNKNKKGTANISDDVLEWVESGENIKEYLNDNLYFTSGGDSMAHVMKGNIGLFISAGKNISTKNISISNVKTKGNLIGISPLLSNDKIITRGGECIGCCVTGSKNIVIIDEKINNIKSDNYKVHNTTSINSEVKHY